MSLDNARKMELARALYLSGNTQQKDLANRVGVTEKTMGRWVAKEQWDKLRKNLLLTREEQMAAMLTELEELNAYIKLKPQGERFASTKEADIRRKLVRDLRELETRASVAETVNVARAMLVWCREHDPAQAAILTTTFDTYIRTRLA